MHGADPSDRRSASGTPHDVSRASGTACVGLPETASRRTGAPARLSLVAPAYNEAETIEPFVRRASAALSALGGPFEVVIVNDGSTDPTLAELHRLRADGFPLTIVNLTRNFGKEIALTAGLAHARGDPVVIIDSDLQDPPELIGELLVRWREGYDVVYAQRVRREGESWLKRTTAEAFYRLIKRIGPVRIPPNTGDFRLMSRRAVDALLSLPEHHRFMKGLYAWIGFHQTAVPYVRQPRYAGSTKWSYWKLWNFSIEAFTSFTIAPLKFSTYLGLLTALFAFLYGAWIVGRTLILGISVPGYASIMASILFVGGIQLIVLGIIGEYLGRMFNETKRRPLYIVEHVAWSDAEGSTPASREDAAPLPRKPAMFAGGDA